MVVVIENHAPCCSQDEILMTIDRTLIGNRSDFLVLMAMCAPVYQEAAGLLNTTSSYRGLNILDQNVVVQIATMFCYGCFFSKGSPSACILVTKSKKKKSVQLYM